MSTHDDPAAGAFVEAFADHLVPEAFATPTHAHRVWLETTQPGVPFGLGFMPWKDERLGDAPAARWPDGDRPWVVAYTSDGHLLRRYDEPGCGDIRCVVPVVAAEAARIAEPWIFAAWLPRGAAQWQAVGNEHDGPEQILVVPPGRRWAAVWYAEARGRGPAMSVAGVVRMDGEEVVDQEPILVTVSPVSKAFHRILFRHPARKRHRLS